MYRRTLSILLIAVLSGIGVASARADQGSAGSKSAPPSSGDDVTATVPARKGRLGIAALEISRELRAHLGAPEDRGVLVESVLADTPAVRAGLRVGDVVTDVAGTPTRSVRDVIGALAERKRGDEVAIAVIRNAQRLELRAKLDSDPGASRQPEMFRRFEQFPDETWFPHGDDQQELRDAIQELRQRMNRLEHRLSRPSSPGDSHPGSAT